MVCATQRVKYLRYIPEVKQHDCFTKKQKAVNLNQHWMYWKDISIVLQEK